jgi:hypothetical protein
LPFSTTLQLLGLAGVLSYAAARFAAKAGVVGYSRYSLVAVPLSGLPKMPRGFTIRPLSFAELGEFDIDAARDEQQRRFDQGLTCLAAFNARGEFVGVTWVGIKPFDESMVRLRFIVPENAIWDTGLWIHPDHRLGRGFAALWAATGIWMQAQGREWSISWIADYNLPSLLSHKRMRSQLLGHITTFRLFRWQFMAHGRPRLIRIDRGQPAEMLLPSPALHAPV